MHLAHTTFPEDPRPRREAMIAAESGARVAIIVAEGGRDNRRVSRYGPLTVVRLKSSRKRGSAANYLFEYLDFLFRARRLIRSHPRFRRARVFHVHTLPDFLVGATRARAAPVPGSSSIFMSSSPSSPGRSSADGKESWASGWPEPRSAGHAARPTR